MFLGNTLNEFRIPLHKLRIALIGWSTDDGENAVLVGDVCILKKKTKESLELGNPLTEQLVRGLFYLEHLSIFQRFDIHGRRGFLDQTFEIGNPPIFHREVGRMLKPLPVDIISAETSLNHKTLIQAHLPRLEKILALSDSAMKEQRLKICRLAIREADVARDVSKNDIEF